MPNNALIGDALPSASASSEAHGIWDGETATVLSASKPVRYSILRPARPVFDEGEATLAEVVGSRPVLLIADRALDDLYGPDWRYYARRHLQPVGELLLDMAEHNKTWDQVDRICEFAVRHSLPRHGVIVAIGGGVTLDTVGFAASIFRRGVAYVRIPTTLVGLVDVAVGVKQGVNAFGGKNLIGSFYAPLAAINDYRFLRTLPPREISCGLAEIVKMALLRDAALFETLEAHGRSLVSSRFADPPDIARSILRRAELLMLEELAPNLFEDDLARLVDFGHTFSPAIETASGFSFKHGEAVALDMLLSAALAVAWGLSNPVFFERLTSLLHSVGLPVGTAHLPAAAVLLRGLEAVRQHRGGSLNLVLVTEPGRPRFEQNVSALDLDRALKLFDDTQPPLRPSLPVEGAAYARPSL